MNMRVIAGALLGLVGAACGLSDAPKAAAAGGSSGSGTSPTGGNGQVGSAEAGIFEQGGSSGAVNLGAGTGGAAGNASPQGGSSGSGTAGAATARGGSPNTADEGGADEGGAAEQAGSAGAAGVAGGLADGAYDFDLEVIYGAESTHITNCYPDLGRMTMIEYPDGNRGGSISCQPEEDGSLNVNSFSFGFYPSAVGENDASTLTYDCDSSTDHCDGVGVYVTVEVTDGVWSDVDSIHADTKSGSFTLDEFTADGGVSGSLDVTMSQGGYEVTIRGHFAAQLKDCGPAATASDSGCLGPHD